jgi:hypothetical protein
MYPELPVTPSGLLQAGYKFNFWHVTRQLIGGSSEWYDRCSLRQPRTVTAHTYEAMLAPKVGSSTGLVRRSHKNEAKIRASATWTRCGLCLALRVGKPRIGHQPVGVCVPHCKQPSP